jgi:hypothetical protein
MICIRKRIEKIDHTMLRFNFPRIDRVIKLAIEPTSIAIASDREIHEGFPSENRSTM